MLKRRQPGGLAPGGTPDTCRDDEFWQHFPALYDFLLLEFWPDTQQPRETGSILLFRQDGLIKVLLKDNDIGEQCWLAYGGPWEALQGANRVLADGGGSWKKAKDWSERKGRGKGSS